MMAEPFILELMMNGTSRDKGCKQACLDIETKLITVFLLSPITHWKYKIMTKRLSSRSKAVFKSRICTNQKAFKRNDTATIEADTLELSRLILEGKNISFEELPCRQQELSFEILHRS